MELVLGVSDKGLCYINEEQRFRHTYIIGATGMGKSTLLLEMIQQDIQNDVGIVVIDPSGSLCEDIGFSVPPHRELAYLSLNNPISANPLSKKVNKYDLIDEFTEIMDTFITLTTATAETTAGMKQILTNAFELLLDYPQYSSIKTLYEFLFFPSLRRKILFEIEHTHGVVIPLFWKELKREQEESAKRVATRISSFIKDPRILNIISGQSKIDFKDIADQKKILLVDCSGMTRDKMIFIGNIISHGVKSYFINNKAENPLAFYVDEFQNFITPNFNKILSEGRKYQVALTLAHQDHQQLPQKLLGSILGNVCTTVCFRCGVIETKTLGEHFRDFEATDLHNLQQYECCVRIDTDEHKIKTLPPAINKRHEILKLQSPKKAPLQSPKEPASPVQEVCYVSLWDFNPAFFSFS